MTATVVFDTVMPTEGGGGGGDETLDPGLEPRGWPWTRVNQINTRQANLSRPLPRPAPVPTHVRPASESINTQI